MRLKLGKYGRALLLFAPACLVTIVAFGSGSKLKQAGEDTSSFARYTTLMDEMDTTMEAIAKKQDVEVLTIDWVQLKKEARRVIEEKLVKEPVVIQPLPDLAEDVVETWQPPEIIVSGILFNGDFHLALIGNQVLAAGDKVLGYTVESITDERVTFMGPDGETRVVDAYEEVDEAIDEGLNQELYNE